MSVEPASKRLRSDREDELQVTLDGLSIACNRLMQITTPCAVPAGLYGVRVRPGRDWDPCLDVPSPVGFTFAPTESDLNEFVTIAVDPVSGRGCLTPDGRQVSHCLGGSFCNVKTSVHESI